MNKVGFCHFRELASLKNSCNFTIHTTVLVNPLDTKTTLSNTIFIFLFLLGSICPIYNFTIFNSACFFFKKRIKTNSQMSRHRATIDFISAEI